MVQLKQKVTLKQKKEPISTPPPKQTKSKLLTPILIFFGLAVLVGGYFLLKPGSSDEREVPSIGVANTNDGNEIIDITDSKSGVQTVEEPKTVTNTQNETGKVITQTTANDSENNIPYKKGVAYNVYQFPFGSDDYSNPNPELDKLVEEMKQNADVKISIEAFTDQVGSVEFNKALSQRRAKAIFICI